MTGRGRQRERAVSVIVFSGTRPGSHDARNTRTSLLPFKKVSR